jgi:predicted dehydrogenase
MAKTAADAREMVAVAKETNKILTIGYQIIKLKHHSINY